jgi:hypothetical protein
MIWNGMAENAIAPRNGGRIQSTFQTRAAPAVVVVRVFRVRAVLV